MIESGGVRFGLARPAAGCAPGELTGPGNPRLVRAGSMKIHLSPEAGAVRLTVLLFGAIVLPQILPALASDAELLPRGHSFLLADFEKADALQGWSGSGKLAAGHESGGSLGVEVHAGRATPTASVVSLELPVEAMRGYLVRGSAWVRAENVSSRPNPWNGIKCMLAVETPERTLWPQAEIGTGSFEWRRVAFTVRVPTNARSARLVLGLEQVTGKAWFDDVNFVVAKPPAPREARPFLGPPFTGREVSRLRGAMISPDIDAEGLRVLGREWGANLIRWQLIRPGRPGQPANDDDYDAWLEGELKKLDAALPLCASNGLRVVVDLHSPPGGKATSGGYVGADDRFFTDPLCQAKFVRVWERITARYRGAAPIWGFDLVNEPVEDFVEEGCDDWQGLAERAARAIRAIDPARTLIVEPAAWGGPGGLADLVPLSVSNVVYSVHMYLPHAFTHQGVHGPGPAYRYPGLIEGKTWGKTQLEAALQPVVDFQRRYGVHIYIGEFSAIRWAPEGSSARYLSDLIDIFEAHQWDWSYHAFREWSGWSVEHGEDRNETQPARQPTERERLLRGWYARNQEPTIEKSLIDYFLPMPIRRALATNLWGAPGVLPRDPGNGLEDVSMKQWCYWDGQILRGTDDQYHLFASRWDQAKGHDGWWGSGAIHAVSDHVIGPYVDTGLCWPDNQGGKGHNVTALILPDQRYAVVVSETRPGDVFVSKSLAGPWEHLGSIQVATNEFSGFGKMSNVSLMLRPDGDFMIVARSGAIWISQSGILGPYAVQGPSVYPAVAGLPLKDLEDPVVWYSGGLYHIVVNSWSDRKAYHLTSKDGVSHWTLRGLAYDPRRPFLRYLDGTVNHWEKIERPGVLLENGHVTHFTFAVLDVPKELEKPNDSHGSKVIVVPFDGVAFDRDLSSSATSR